MNNLKEINDYFRNKSLRLNVTPCLNPHLGNIQLREANGVHDYIKERTIRIGNHVVETRKTVRMIAKEFGVSKSTVHKDLTERDRKSTRLNSSHVAISYAVFCLKKKKKKTNKINIARITIVRKENRSTG